ncbi:MAG TPA: flavin reductase family protein [Gemmataceae bacterium]|nr:flavin reductase family protein [Gemmataceae bacterium]
MPFDSAMQRRIMGRFATGVTVITARVGDQLWGMTANAVASLSLEPPLVLVAVAKNATMNGYLKEARAFAMNILTEAQEGLSRRFAQRGPKEWGDIPLATAVTGSPVFAEALAWLDCRVADILPGGDHDIFLGEILAGDARDGRPLMYFCGNYARLPE